MIYSYIYILEQEKERADRCKLAWPFGNIKLCFISYCFP